MLEKIILLEKTITSARFENQKIIRRKNQTRVTRIE